MLLQPESYSGGLLGLSPPGPVKSIDFEGFQAPTGAEPFPPGKPSPSTGQIPEYAPNYYYSCLIL